MYTLLGFVLFIVGTALIFGAGVRQGVDIATKSRRTIGTRLLSMLIVAIGGAMTMYGGYLLTTLA